MKTRPNIIVGANAGRSRHHNRQVVLDQVRASGKIGRAEIARASGLSIQAVSNITADLLEEALIVELGRRASARGKPPLQYALNPRGGYAIGVEIRPDAIFAAILDLCGTMVMSERWPLTDLDRDALTALVADLIEHVQRVAEVPDERVLGVGIVMPGPFGQTGIRGEGAELPVWEPTPPDTWFAQALGLPVIVENDANAAAMAEMLTGVAHGHDSFAFIYFGNGIGLGTIEHGRLIKGGLGKAGEIGHITVPHRGKQVALEAAVSRLSVQSHLLSAGITVQSGADLEQLAQTDNPVLKEWLEAAVPALSTAITVVENLFDPELIILGGAMPDAILDYFVDHVQLSEKSVAHRQGRRAPRLQKGRAGRITATLGAAAIVLNHSFTPKISAIS